MLHGIPESPGLAGRAIANEDTPPSLVGKFTNA